MESLARLLGSPSRPKVLRLFIFNQDGLFTLEDIASRAKISPKAARKEVVTLVAAGFLKRRRGKDGAPTYLVNRDFEHLDALDAFVRQTCVLRPADILALVRKVGALKLVTLSGLFTNAVEPKVDLLVVGDGLEERVLARVVAELESELGREIRYASFATADFRYRRGVYDRLIRDVFDYPHRIILDKIGL